MGHLVLAFVLAAAAVGDSVESFEAGPCDTEVAKANTECTAANAAHRKTAKDTCGTADYDARMKKVAELQKLAGSEGKRREGGLGVRRRENFPAHNAEQTEGTPSCPEKDQSRGC